MNAPQPRDTSPQPKPESRPQAGRPLALGRGLDDLMQEATRQQEDLSSSENTNVAPGLRILIRGSDTVKPAGSNAPAAGLEPQPATTKFVTVVLVATDLALLLWPAVWIWQHAGGMTFIGMFACAASILLGAIAAVCAIFSLRS